MLQNIFSKSYKKLPPIFYSPAILKPMPKSKVIRYNEDLACSLGLSKYKEDIKNIVTGKKLAEQGSYIAMAYAGHQFGHFVPRLGDGRAMLIGEILNQESERFDLHLKGSGPTLYSRHGDGKSALGPVLREFLVSEGMHYLGVPTSRSLAVISTGEEVYRESPLPGAVLARVASSHIRVGTFEFFAAKEDVEGLKNLLDYSIDRHFTGKQEIKTLELLNGVIHKTALLIAHWMSLGFIHGVMNTDNMSISGETLDYGPCAFMDEFKFNKVFSYVDRNGRYAYQQQPIIAQWNCARLADCLSLLHQKRGFQYVPEMNSLIEDFPNIYQKYWLQLMRPKLGLIRADDSDEHLINLWLKMLEQEKLDFTNSFRHLGLYLSDPEDDHLPKVFDTFLVQWKKRLAKQEIPFDKVGKKMKEVNPIYIPRNHLIERAISNAYEGDLMEFHKLCNIFTKPFKNQSLPETYFKRTTDDPNIKNTFCGT